MSAYPLMDELGERFAQEFKLQYIGLTESLPMRYCMTLPHAPTPFIIPHVLVYEIMQRLDEARKPVRRKVKQ